MAENGMIKNGTMTIVLRVLASALLSAIILAVAWTANSIMNSNIEQTKQQAALETLRKDFADVAVERKEIRTDVSTLKLFVATTGKDIEQIKKDIVEIKNNVQKIRDRLPTITAVTVETSCDG